MSRTATASSSDRSSATPPSLSVSFTTVGSVTFALLAGRGRRIRTTRFRLVNTGRDDQCSRSLNDHPSTAKPSNATRDRTTRSTVWPEPDPPESDSEAGAITAVFRSDSAGPFRRASVWALSFAALILAALILAALSAAAFSAAAFSAAAFSAAAFAAAALAALILAALSAAAFAATFAAAAFAAAALAAAARAAAASAAARAAAASAADCEDDDGAEVVTGACVLLEELGFGLLLAAGGGSGAGPAPRASPAPKSRAAAATRASTSLGATRRTTEPQSTERQGRLLLRRPRHRD